MRLLFWNSDGSMGKNYTTGTFELMGLLVHEMAPVAWDRDCDEILRGHEVETSLRVLITSRGSEPEVYLMTGEMKCLARWDSANLKWIRNHNLH